MCPYLLLLTCSMAPLLPSTLVLVLLPSTLATSILLTGGGLTDSGPLLSSTEVVDSPCTSPSLPFPRAAHTTSLTTDGLLLTCGGRGEEAQDLLSCLVMDTSSSSWLPHSTLPIPRTASTAVSLPTGLLLLGGWGGAGSSSLLPTGATSWEAGPPGAPMQVAYTCAVTLDHGGFLVLGGLGAPEQVEEYTSSSSWHSWPPLHQERWGHACARLGDLVVLAGGWDRDGAVLASTTILALSSGAQRPGGDLATPRAALAMIAMGGRLFALGGLVGDARSSSNPAVGSYEVWEEEEEEWRSGGGLDNPRAALGAVAVHLTSVCPV